MLRSLRGWLYRIRGCIILGLSLGLVGCADYDLTLQFDHSHHGEIRQLIHLAQPITEFNPAPPWLQALEDQTQRAHGRVKRRSPQDWELRLPIANGTDFVTTLTPIIARLSPTEASDAVTRSIAVDPSGIEHNRPLFPPSDQPIPAQVSLEQINRVLAVKNHLVLDLDLTALALQSATGQALFNTGNLVHLGLNVVLPQAIAPAAFTPSQPEPVLVSDRQLRWEPQPGQVNHLELDFWLPNPIAIGALVILGLVSVGWVVRSRLFS